MDNQHKLIKGYRDLTPGEITVMNAVKAQALETESMVEFVKNHLANQLEDATGDVEENQRLKAAEPGRWAAIARTHFQEGYMALVRAVAQPSTF